MLRIAHAVAFGGDLVPQLGERPHLAELGDELEPGVDEERDAADHVAERVCIDFSRRLHGIEHGDRGRQRERQLLHRRRARLLQMVGAHVHRVPFRQFRGREQDHVLGQPHGGRRREHVGAAREIFLDDVVLGGALQGAAVYALLVRHRDIERQQPGGRGVDGHRGVHLAERDVLEQHAHVAEVRDRHAYFSDFASGERMVAIVAGLRRQIEGDREPGLPLGEIFAVERVRLARVRMPRIGAEYPGLLALRCVFGHGAIPCR